MPTYSYKCEDCFNKYEVFHKSSEKPEDIICPKCKSKNYKKIMSLTSISMGGGSKSEAPQCGTGCCPGCSLN